MKEKSLLKKLKKEEIINDSFLEKVSTISLEDLIAIKLELSSRHFGGKLFGLPIFHSVKEITNDALLKFAFSASRTKKEGAALLGMTTKDYRSYLRKFKIEELFEIK